MGRDVKVTGYWIDSASSQRAMTLLTDAGHAAYFVGGCVRNALLDFPVSDIDIATGARPEQVLDLAEKAGIRAIPTGIEHGTITVVIEDLPHEVTTFRKDVATDGRHATVSFSTDITDDARRRDFTMNALYADADGYVQDPLGGLPDLKGRRIRFIEDPATRIREDYLRILRFFRFHAWFGDPSGGLDPDGLAACAELADGVDHLSKERVGTEMIKLLSAVDPAPSVAAMRQAGILSRVLPGADDTLFAPLVHLEDGLPSAYLRRLVVLGGENVRENLRLSKADARGLEILRVESGNTSSAKELGYRYGADTGKNILLLRATLSHLPLTDRDLNDLEVGQAAEFPVKASDLMPEFEGPALGQKLKELEKTWIASGLTLKKSDLLR